MRQSIAPLFGFCKFFFVPGCRKGSETIRQNVIFVKISIYWITPYPVAWKDDAAQIRLSGMRVYFCTILSAFHLLNAMGGFVIIPIKTGKRTKKL